MAGYAGLVQQLGSQVADPGVPGGARAGPGFVVPAVPDVYLEVQLDALVVGPLVQDVTGRQPHVPLE